MDAQETIFGENSESRIQNSGHFSLTPYPLNPTPLRMLAAQRHLGGLCRGVRKQSESYQALNLKSDSQLFRFRSPRLCASVAKSV